MLLHKSVEHDSRVQREARALVDAGHEVVIVHLAPRGSASRPPTSPYALRSAALPAIRRRAWLVGRMLEAANMARIAARLRADAVHAHDAAMLVPGYLAARASGAKLVYDSHELATGVPYRSGPWARLVVAIERTMVPRCDEVITVSDGIAARLRERYALEAPPVVVRNLPDLPPPAEPPRVDLRGNLRLGGDPLVLHQGAVAPDRGCEVLIRAMGELHGAHLLFLGAEGSYAEGLKAAARQSGAGERIHFRAPAALHELLSFTAQADVGVSLLRGNCENHRLALPNKLFEYVAAGVPVAVGALPEMERLIASYGNGVTVDPEDPGEVARGLREVIEDEGQRFADGAARARVALNWDAERERLLGAYAAIGSAAREDTAPPRPSAVVLVRNPVNYDGRVLRAARTLIDMGQHPVVVGVTSTEVKAPRWSARGVPVVRLCARSPFELITASRRRVGKTPEAGSGGMANGSPNGSSVPTPLLRLHRLLRTLDFYRRGIGAIRAWRPTILHCCDYNTMWIGVVGKALFGCSIVYDAHELWPDRNQRSEPRWWLVLCEAFFVRVADHVIATSPGHAGVIAKRYRVQEPTVIRNIPEAENVPARPAAEIDKQLAVYVGAVTTNRGLEQSLEALALIDDLRLRIVGPGRNEYRNRLRDLAGTLGLHDRVEIVDPVPATEVTRAIAGAGVGLALIQPSCLSYAESLPNKLFEYLSAGLPVLASDLPVLGGFVTEHEVGMVARPADATEIAAKLQSIVEPTANQGYREAVERLASELDWRNESMRLGRVYESVLPVPAAVPA